MQIALKQQRDRDGWTSFDVRQWIKAKKASDKLLKAQIKSGQHWINDPVRLDEIKGELGL